MAVGDSSLTDYQRSWLQGITSGNLNSSISDLIRLYTNAAPTESINDARRRYTLASGTLFDSIQDLERKYWLYVGNETFTNTDLKYTAYKGLATTRTLSPVMNIWSTALTNRNTTPAKIAIIGDSISEGQGASTRDKRWTNLLREQMRSEYGVTQKGEGYVPSYYYVGAPDSPWQSYSAYNGTPTQSIVNGSLGYRTIILDGSDSLFYPNIVGTEVDIWWTGGGGTLGYQIDGGAVQTINTFAGGVYHTDYRTAVSLGASGVHNIGIGVTAGTVGFSGFTVYDGDKTKGIQFYDSAHSGSKTADHLVEGGEYIKALQTVAPQLVIIELGGNDAMQSIPVATFGANLQTIVSGALGSIVPKPSVLVVSIYNAANGIFPGGIVWADYKAAMASVVASDPTNVTLLDLATYMPTTDFSGTGFYSTDGIHPNDAGHARIATLVHNAICTL